MADQRPVEHEKSITVRLPVDLHGRLRAQAKREDRSLSNLMRVALKWYIARETPR